MVNIDKEKINDNINDAYNNQTEKVKQLLESAKKNLADQKECLYDYTANKEKVKQLYQINRVVSKKKDQEKQKEEKIEEKFIKMNERLNVHSKNLDVIFENVSQNNSNQISILNEICQKQKQTGNTLNKAVEEAKKSENRNKQYVIEIKDNIQSHVAEAKVETIKTFSEEQNKLQDTLLNANSNMEYNILTKQKESENRIMYSQGAIENRIQELQEINEEKLNSIKEEIIKAYQKENKHAISSLLEERNGYLRELQEKDKEIRELNYKIYEYEEKLEKEIAKREKFSIFAPFFRKQEVQEEEPTYTPQILNYVY